MAVLRIRKLGDPVLREKARPVERFDGTLRRLVDDMLETMYAAPGVGLAAPQVGVSLRLFVYDDGEGNTGAVANPELSDLEDEETRDEGCLSIPGPFYPTVRSLRATLRGQDAEGRPLELRGEGLLARIFQHETDHTQGVLYIDRLPPEGRREVMRLLRDHEVKQQQERSPTP
ncbi:MAG: peptide deformylase [Actinobacteria bacterium]|nr:MAG: peptide deformylase [Actinomycetota bacterium]